jgi:addiction module RelE/StbE family toxin
MKIFWTEAALNQLESIRNYLAQTSPEYARKVVESVVKRSEQIGAFPYSGRMVPEYEISEVRQVIESSYRIIYLIKEEQIEVLAIIHTTRRGLPQEE